MVDVQTIRLASKNPLESFDVQVPMRQPSFPTCRLWPFLAGLLTTITGLSLPCVAFGEDEDNVGVRVPPGFEVSLYADDDLAHDIFSMTIDSLGRVVVSGPGYVRILIDTDGDGKAETFKQFADGPKTGAQGMYFLGRHLLCTGDAGLIFYRDRNADDRADGKPDVFLKIKTGSEHHAHAIRKGPDGWWYMIAGNSAEVTDTYATLPTSPIKKPAAGTLLRLKPDLSGGEIVADGFRNAYDFAFNRQGDLFTYDSDGERDVSLPWYRPTRVFHVLPGSNAGWVSRSWKRPGYFFDMPPVVASVGRGSPTGVACYRHTQFPHAYDGALFVLDWTFGRVLALPIQRSGETWKAKPIAFMTGAGQFGFAPTDVAVGPDGSLFVCVGGRGTRGGVFRVTYKGAKPKTVPQKPESMDEKLAACLDAPQPLSSWSRARWLPLAKQLDRKPFITATLDARLPVKRRLRAIEILTELFDGLDSATAKKLAFDRSAEVRARAVWSLGRTGTARPDTELIALFLNSDDPLVARCALEALQGAGAETDFSPLRAGLARQLGSKSRYTRQAATRIIPKLRAEGDFKLTTAISSRQDQAKVMLAFGALGRGKQAHRAIDLDALTRGLKFLSGEEYPVEFRLEAVRFMQMALGDVGPKGGKLPPVYDGYASRLDLSRYERDLDPVRIGIAGIYPTGQHQLDYELARLIAMLSPANPKLLDGVLAQITDESHPVDDIHHLIVASRIPVGRGRKQRAVIAKALIDLESKLTARKLHQDSNWDDRIGEMYAELVRHDPLLPVALLKQPKFGRPGHVIFLSQLPREYLQEAIAAFVRDISSDDDYPWTTDVVFVLGESDVAEHRQLVREQFENFALRSAVLLVLADKPETKDREKFIKGLDSALWDVLAACVDALGKLPVDRQAAEQWALLRLLRRLGTDPQEYPLREEVVKLLRRNTGRNFGYVFGKEGRKPQKAVIEKWTEAISRLHPSGAATLLGNSQRDVEELKTLLSQVDWDRGDPQRGGKLFKVRSCSQCHGGHRALGPDLAGVGSRFSRNDLFTAITLPNRDVSPRYQTTLIQTTKGKVYSGLVVYDSIDGVMLRNSTNQTFRIETDEIELRRTMNTSLMPTGLLKDLKPADLADLYAYIQSLGG